MQSCSFLTSFPWFAYTKRMYHSLKFGCCGHVDSERNLFPFFNRVNYLIVYVRLYFPILLLRTRGMDLDIDAWVHFIARKVLVLYFVRALFNRVLWNQYSRQTKWESFFVRFTKIEKHTRTKIRNHMALCLAITWESEKVSSNTRRVRNAFKKRNTEWERRLYAEERKLILNGLPKLKWE